MGISLNKNQIDILMAVSKGPLSSADIRKKIEINPLRFVPQMKALINLYFIRRDNDKYTITPAGMDIVSQQEKDIQNKGLFK